MIATYSFPTETKVSLVLEQLTYNTDDKITGNVNEYKRIAWYSVFKQRFGPHQVWASYGVANAGSCTRVGGGPVTTNGLGAAQYSLGYSYSLSAASDIFASYYGTANDRSASYAVFPSPGTVAPGSTTQGIGLGMLFTF